MPKNDGPQSRLAPPIPVQFDRDHISRRELLSRAAAIGGGLALAPLAFSGTASARTPDTSLALTLDEFIASKMKVAWLPSMAGAAVLNQNLIWINGYGMADREQIIPADPDTDYMLASISKTFICAAVMQLWEAASLDLDADINTYLPFDVRTPAYPGNPITMRMLLTHTSAIADRWAVWGTLEEQVPQGYCFGDATIALGDWLADYLVPGGAYYVGASNFYTSVPGVRYRYSNIGADLAAYIVEVISGEPFGDYVQTHLLRPLRMTESGFHLSDLNTTNLAVPYRAQKSTNTYIPYPQFGYPDYPSGLMRTSANNLSIWMRCFMNFGTFEGTTILQPATVQEIFRLQIPGNSWQGLIFYRVKRARRTYIGHSGSDYGTHTDMFFSLENGNGAIVMGNRYIETSKEYAATQAILIKLLALGLVV